MSFRGAGDSSWFGARVVGLVVAATLVMAGLVPGSAFAEMEIGSSGTGAGQVDHPIGAAVDETDELLYVVDGGNDRIVAFDTSSGDFVKAFGWGVLDGSNELQVCTATCLSGIAGSGAGQLKGAVGIAVDNDSSSSGLHSVYVFENGNSRIQKFSSSGGFVWAAGDGVNATTGGDLCTDASGNKCGSGTSGNAPGQFNQAAGDTIDVGPGGTVYVGDRVNAGTPETRVQKFSPAGAYLGLLGGKLLSVTGGADATSALAVDSEGDVYVGSSGELGTGAVRKYDASGNELLSFNHSLNVNTVDVDPEDHVFVGDNSQFEGEIVSGIYEYDAGGTLLRAIYGSLEGRTFGLAVFPNPNGDIFAVAEGSGGKVKILDIDFPPPGPLVYPKPSALFVAPLGNTKATLHGKVNPEGEATTYHFEYITDADFDAAGETFGAGTIETTEEGPLPADFQLHPVQAEIKDLQPETVYHFRIVVASAATGSDGNPGPVTTFTTKQPLEFGDVWSSDVRTTTATLNGEVNPLGIPATARFEYVELSKYEASGFSEAIKAPGAGEDPIDLGGGEETLDISVDLAGLQPGTSYRYRIVATDRCKPEPAPLCEFSEPEGAFATFLPVSSIRGCPNDALRAAGAGAFLPDCRGYEMVSPVDKEGAYIEPVFNISGFPAGLDQAAADGNSITFSAYRAFGDVDGAPYTNQYLARRDAASGWTTEGISPEREGPSLMTYLSAQLDRQYRGFGEDLCNGWAVQDANPILSPEGIEDFPGLYRRDNCGPGLGGYEALITVAPPSLPPRKVIPDLQGTSADGSVAIFTVNDNLVSGVPNQPLACRNETKPSEEACLSRLYEAREGVTRYVCILPNGNPYSGRCAAGAPSDSKTGRTAGVSNAISADGSRIFWTASANGPGALYVRIDNSLPSAKTIAVTTSAARFWAAAEDGSVVIYSIGQGLFEFDVDSQTTTPIAEGVEGVAGASEDASRVYFASTKALTGEDENSEGDKATAGEPNLYLYDGSGFKFVGTLVDSDLLSGSQPSSPVADTPIARLSRVTPDGEGMVFMSSARITGYDNTDAVTKKIAMEVFYYDANANEGAGEILCPSCNPSGARPQGRQLTQKLLESRWAAARIPVYESQLYGARMISDDGNRVYFDSFDALSPLDVNGEEDAYQWQTPGSGSCTTQSPTYHEVSGGCVDLVSSGNSPQGSEITDISTDGHDVFFKTTQSLVNQDPGLRDIYDARVEGGFPPLPPKPVICQGEGCLEPPAQAPAEVAPASRVSGPGNPQTKPKPNRCHKGTHKVKRRGKIRCVKSKHRKHAGQNRGAAR